MSYLPGNLGKIGQTINKVAGFADSITGNLPENLKNKVEKYTGKGSVSNNLNTANNTINRLSDNSFNLSNFISRAANNYRSVYDPGDQA
jgi:hypothetical protein